MVGIILGMLGLGMLASGAFARGADQERDSAGYLTTAAKPLTTDSCALTTSSLEVDASGPDAVYVQETLGTVRIRGTAADPAKPLFIGVGPADAVAAYLANVRHDEVADVDVEPFRVSYQERPGGAPGGPPTAQGLWAAADSGTGTRTLTWKVPSGDWSIVVMNADGSPGVRANLSLGATLPIVGWIADGLLIGGGVLLALGAVLVLLAVLTRPRPASRRVRVS